MKRLTALILISCLVMGGCANGQAPVVTPETTGQVRDWDYAETTAFGKYPELVKYTLGKMTGLNNSNMPEGDTYENNAYTRYLKNKLNIQNKDQFEINESDNYTEAVSMAITAKELPDVMVLDDMSMLPMLVEKDMIEDLTQVYEDCASDRIKAIYASYGEQILDNVTFDGKIMALPETNIDNGPSLLWLRKDWMDKLHLAEPQTVEDACHIIRAFVQKDPGENGAGKTVGLVCDSDLTGGCGYSSEYQTDIIFASYGAFPKQWILDASGNVVYGSVQSEAKEGLQKLRQMYSDGVLDNDFLMRGSSNIIKLIVSGQCGSFFGPWWAPNNPLMEAMQENPDAEWEPYLIQTEADGSTRFASQKPTDKCVVVRKGCKHPEVVMKIISTLFDTTTYGENGQKEMQEYYQDNVDPTARPLAINVDYKDALLRCYQSLKDALQGIWQLSQLSMLEGSYYIACTDYLKGRGNGSKELSWEDWAAYKSRITACGVLSQGESKEVESLFFGETDTMKSNWWKLESMEKETYLKIVTGEEPLSYFDAFVREWKKQGGSRITKEVADALSGKQQ